MAEHQTLTVWSSYANQDMQILIENYQSVRPNVEVIHTTQELPTYFSFLKERMGQGVGPDLAIVPDQELPSLIGQGVAEDLDKYQLKTDDFYSKSLVSLRGGGKHLYSVPFDFQTMALCYNSSQTSDPPTTLDAVLAQSNQGKGVAIDPGFVNSAWGIGAMGGTFFNSLDQFVLEERAVSRWLSWLKNAQQTQNIFIDSRRSVLFNLFATEKVTYFPCWTFELAALQKELGDHLGVAVLPGDLNSATPVLETDALVLNVHATTAQKKLALEFAEFVTRREQQLAFQSAQDTIVIPINPKVLIDRRLLPIRRSLIEQVQQSFPIPIAQPQYQTKRLVNYGDAIYTQVMQGDLSPAAGANRFIDQINQPVGQKDIINPTVSPSEADSSRVRSEIAPQADYLLRLFRIQFQILRRPIIWLQIIILTVVTLLVWLSARRLNQCIKNFSQRFID